MVAAGGRAGRFVTFVVRGKETHISHGVTKPKSPERTLFAEKNERIKERGCLFGSFRFFRRSRVPLRSSWRSSCLSVSHSLRLRLLVKTGDCRAAVAMTFLRNRRNLRTIRNNTYFSSFARFGVEAARDMMSQAPVNKGLRDKEGRSSWTGLQVPILGPEFP